RTDPLRQRHAAGENSAKLGARGHENHTALHRRLCHARTRTRRGDTKPVSRGGHRSLTAYRVAVTRNPRSPGTRGFLMNICDLTHDLPTICLIIKMSPSHGLAD